MKGIKVIDVGSNPEETQFGTCELCFSYRKRELKH